MTRRGRNLHTTPADRERVTLMAKMLGLDRSIVEQQVAVMAERRERGGPMRAGYEPIGPQAPAEPEACMRCGRLAERLRFHPRATADGKPGVVCTAIWDEERKHRIDCHDALTAEDEAALRRDQAAAAAASDNHPNAPGADDGDGARLGRNSGPSQKNRRRSTLKLVDDPEGEGEDF